MFFPLSKLSWMLLTPSNALMLLLCVATLWLAFAAARGRSVRISGLCSAILATAMLIFAVTPIGRLPLAAVEDRFPTLPLSALPDDLAGAIVLGGALSLARSEAMAQVQFNEAADRIAALLVLAHLRPDLPIVFTGGDGALFGDDGSEAELLATWLASVGLDTRRILFEPTSRNTYENAVRTKAALDAAGRDVGGRWLLVTSAFHMPRAVGTFRAQGFDVVPYPVDYRLPLDGTGLTPVSFGLGLLDLGVREWLGLAAYRLAGYSSDVWPSPSPGSASR